MSGQPLTVLERAEQRENYTTSTDVTELTWLADWRAVGLPYCSLYVIAPLDGWPCKIGISTNPLKRINALQTSVWKQLEVKWCGFVGTTNIARSLERRCHEALTEQAKWLHGEWFDLRPDKAIELIGFEAALAGVELVTSLPEGKPRAFVQALFDQKYTRPSGMAAQIDRKHKSTGIKYDIDA